MKHKRKYERDKKQHNRYATLHSKLDNVFKHRSFIWKTRAFDVAVNLCCGSSWCETVTSWPGPLSLRPGKYCAAHGSSAARGRGASSLHRRNARGVQRAKMGR